MNIVWEPVSQLGSTHKLIIQDVEPELLNLIRRMVGSPYKVVGNQHVWIVLKPATMDRLRQLIAAQTSLKPTGTSR